MIEKLLEENSMIEVILSCLVRKHLQIIAHTLDVIEVRENVCYNVKAGTIRKSRSRTHLVAHLNWNNHMNSIFLVLNFYLSLLVSGIFEAQYNEYH